MKNFLLISILIICAIQGAKAQQIDTLIGPTGSEKFGQNITILSNGNYVIVDSDYDEGTVQNVGAVYLYNGATNTLISTLKGSTVNDRIGRTSSTLVPGITALSNGNYLVNSPSWDNGSIVQAGAVTWCNGITGITGTVSSSNSLVGSTANDGVGGSGITTLNNGNYVVNSSFWDNGSIINAGAVTWCNGSIGRSGFVNSSNSLVGSTADDFIGTTSSFFFDNSNTILSNGNYVVSSLFWDNGSIVDAGAVTWCNGSTGRTGTLTSSNSLVGSTANDQIGRVTPLNNGNYVVSSTSWDNGSLISVGAVTWCNGSIGRTGAVSSSNSLVGSTANDNIGNNVKALSNGNYVVSSSVWDNGSIVNAGAITWCNGSTGRTGIVSSSNSLVGGTTNDFVGNRGITALSNGNYVVPSTDWDNRRGAVTWCNGSSGRIGTVSSSNSLVGSTVDDQIGIGGITSLNNGNYTVSSRLWNNGSIIDAGAITWCNGSIGRTGAVSTSNSLVGSTANDQIGDNNNITVLSNGNYVVKSQDWDNGKIVDAGAVTWCNGSTGAAGKVSSSNSLVGSTTKDFYGYFSISALINGNYIVTSPLWDNGKISDAGASTWCNGSVGRTGAVSSSNSLVGSTANDEIGSRVIALSNGNYLVISPSWNNEKIIGAGSVTWCDGNTGNTATGKIGPVSSSNSLVGSSIRENLGLATALNNGGYIAFSTNFKNGSIVGAGAIKVSCKGNPIIGLMETKPILVGSTENELIDGGLLNTSIGTVIITTKANKFYVYSCTKRLAPEITLSGNSVNIINGKLLASFADSTHFGATKISKKVNYKIKNTGTDTLRLNAPFVAIKGINALDFKVTTMPASKIAPRDSSSFVITFLSRSIGIKEAIVEIVSNDADEETFIFAIQAQPILDCNFNSPLANNLNTTYTAAFVENTPDNWSCYCDSSGSLLLALKLGSSGTIITPSQVQLQIGNNKTFSSTSTGGLINNPAGYTIIDRRWDVNPTTPPNSPVGIKYFFTKTEFDSIVVKLAAMATPSIITNVNQLNIFKATSWPQFADPHTVSGFVLKNGSTPSLTIWKDSVNNTGVFSAEFKVSSFSGSGGIGFGFDDLSLKVKSINNNANDILVYPNPAKSAFTLVNNNINEVLTFVMYNNAGQHIMNGTFSNKAVINTQVLNPGIYLLSLSNGQNLKIVIE